MTIQEFLNIEHLGFYVIIGGIVLAGVMLFFDFYKGNFKNKRSATKNYVSTSKVTQPTVEIQESEKTLSPIKSSRLHEVMHHELSSVETNLGMLSGIKFGFGFAMGVFLFSLILFIFFGSVIIGFLTTIFN
jgi:hypothetical protein